MGWLSAAVEKLKQVTSEHVKQTYIWLFLVGITVFLGINLVKTPPVVSIPRVSGVNIDEDDISGSFRTRENTTLNGSTVGNSLIGVDTLGRLLATKVLLKELLDFGNTSGSTNEHDLERR